MKRSREGTETKERSNALSREEFLAWRRLLFIHDKIGGQWYICDRRKQGEVLGTLFRGKELRKAVFIPDGEQPLYEYGRTWQAYTFAFFDGTTTCTTHLAHERGEGTDGVFLCDGTKRGM